MVGRVIDGLTTAVAIAFAVVAMVWLIALFTGALRRVDGEPARGVVWSTVRPPPGAPAGMECWVLEGGPGQVSWGGPTCFVREE